MPATVNRKCHKCGFSYSYEDLPNVIVFCPECGHFDHMCCDLGLDPDTSCAIFHGKKQVASVVSKDSDLFLVSEKYQLNVPLEGQFHQALMKAASMVSDLINGEE